VSPFGVCNVEDCENEAAIVTRFQSLALRELGPPITRFDHEVERAWCWPCFAMWTERLKSPSAGLGPGRLAIIREGPEVRLRPLNEVGDGSCGAQR
jgi:hypothetical protein